MKNIPDELAARLPPWHGEEANVLSCNPNEGQYVCPRCRSWIDTDLVGMCLKCELGRKEMWAFYKRRTNGMNDEENLAIMLALNPLQTLKQRRADKRLQWRSVHPVQYLLFGYPGDMP